MVKNKLKIPLWDFYNKATIKSNKLLKSKITLFNLVTSQLEFDFGRQKSFYQNRHKYCKWNPFREEKYE